MEGHNFFEMEKIISDSVLLTETMGVDEKTDLSFLPFKLDLLKKYYASEMPMYEFSAKEMESIVTQLHFLESKVLIDALIFVRLRRDRKLIVDTLKQDIQYMYTEKILRYVGDEDCGMDYIFDELGRKDLLDKYSHVEVVIIIWPLLYHIFYEYYFQYRAEGNLVEFQKSLSEITHMTHPRVLAIDDFFTDEERRIIIEKQKLLSWNRFLYDLLYYGARIFYMNTYTIADDSVAVSIKAAKDVVRKTWYFDEDEFMKMFINTEENEIGHYL